MFKFLTHTSFVFILCIFVFPMNMMADNGRNKIIRSNWPAEFMGTNDSTDGNVCIQPNNNGQIEIELSYIVRNSVYDAGCLPIYLAYTVGNESAVLSESDMNQEPYEFPSGPYILPNGVNIPINTSNLNLSFPNTNVSLYTRFYKTVEVDLSDLYDNYAGFFDYTFKVMTATGSLYVGEYKLFVEYLDRDIGSSFIPEMISGTKPFCIDNSGYVQTNNPKTIAESKQIANSNEPNDNKLLPTSNTIEQVEVFPNPFHNEINISNIKGDINIRVVDINGRLIYKEHIDLRNIGSTIKLDTHTWSKGLYFCQLESTTEVKVVKLYK